MFNDNMANVNNGFCNSICSHPTCWNYYRNIIKNKFSSSDNFEKKALSVVLPHQSIFNFNLGGLSIAKSNSKALNNIQNTKSNNEIIEYLQGRKKSSNNAPLVIPQINNGSFLKESTNINYNNVKLSHLNVHEIFDAEEFQNDLERPLRSKDIYVWIPRYQIDPNSKIKKQLNKPSRIVKTPILQLAPVIENQDSSSRKNISSISGRSAIINKNSNNTKILVKKSPKKKQENIQLNINSIENIKENVHRKSLEAALYPQKMIIHKTNNRILNRSETTLHNQIYLLDPLMSDYSLVKNNGNCLKSNDSRKPNFIKNQISKGISIVNGDTGNNNLELRLVPRRLKNSLNSEVMRTSNNGHLLSYSKSMCDDTLVANALSDRSTINDEYFYPGSNLLEILQNSYKLVQERSENLEESCASSLKNKNEQNRLQQQQDQQQQQKDNIQKIRLTKSAIDSDLPISSYIPSPPPPSPDILNRFRSISATVDLVRNEREINYSSEQ